MLVRTVSELARNTFSSVGDSPPIVETKAKKVERVHLPGKWRVLMEPMQINDEKGIYISWVDERHLNLNKLDIEGFENELLQLLYRTSPLETKEKEAPPKVNQVILDFTDCYYESEPKNLQALYGSLLRVTKAFEFNGKKFLMCHLPQPLYDFIESVNAPFLRRLNMHGAKKDAITHAHFKAYPMIEIPIISPEDPSSLSGNHTG